MIHRSVFGILIGTALAVSQGAHAAGNLKKGADAFAEECGDCHSLTEGKNKKGPSLHGVFGRQAGSLNGYGGYSEAMKQTGFVWTEEKVDAYITQPRKLVPGGKMKYDGLQDASQRADIIAYLSSVK